MGNENSGRRRINFREIGSLRFRFEDDTPVELQNISCAEAGASNRCKTCINNVSLTRTLENMHWKDRILREEKYAGLHPYACSNILFETLDQKAAQPDGNILLILKGIPACFAARKSDGEVPEFIISRLEAIEERYSTVGLVYAIIMLQRFGIRRLLSWKTIENLSCQMEPAVYLRRMEEA